MTIEDGTGNGGGIRCAYARKKTWHLVSPNSNKNLIDYKWIYRIKKHMYILMKYMKEHEIRQPIMSTLFPFARQFFFHNSTSGSNLITFG
jgi:hypothetical protein